MRRDLASPAHRRVSQNAPHAWPDVHGKGRPFVALRDVALVYGDEGQDGLAVQGLDLSVSKGSFVAIVGPSGCGKSTIMKLAAGLLPPTAGTVTVDARVVTEPVDGVGMAFQASTLLPWRTTLQNVLLPLEIAQPFRGEFRRRRKEHVARAMDLLSTVGLADFAHKYPWQLSGGMQQRANLCRALIHEPSLLMLDEPFGALDAFTREGLWQVLQDLWIARGFTAILVTHDLREAVYLADEVHVMSRRPGRIIASQRVEIERPRTLAATFREPFAAIVQDLRERIALEQEVA